MSLFSAYLTHASALADSKMEPVEIVAALKEAGASQIETVLALKKLGYSLPEADNLVLHSPVWEENLETNLQTRNVFFDALEEEDGSSTKH